MLKFVDSLQMTIIIGASVAIAVLFLLVLIVCCSCFCRSGRKSHQKNVANGNSSSMAKDHHQLNNGFSTDSQRLLQQQQANGNGGLSSNPLPKPPRMGEYHGLPQTDGSNYQAETEMQDLRAPSVISSSKHSSSGNGSDRPMTALSRSSYSHGHLVDGGVATVPQHFYPPPPDLLVKLPPPHSVSPASTNASSNGSHNSSNGGRGDHVMHTLNPAGLMMSPAQQQQYLMQHNQSPFTRSGTLPLPHHYPSHHPRSVSCDHSGTLPHPHHSFTLTKPVIQLLHVNSGHTRPGYVTLPRRPRTTAWSLPRDTPSPGGSSVVSGVSGLREPIYDGVGPRTSADGSSRLHLNQSQPLQPLPVVQQPQGRYALPPYYAPIEELAECPPTPKKKPEKIVKSTPNVLQMNNKRNGHKQSTASIATTASGSEVTLMEESLSAYCEPFGKALPPDEPDKETNNHSVASNGFKSSTPLRYGDVDTNTAKRPAPRTLPKPKVKPVPPPKPKKSFVESSGIGDEDDDNSSSAPLISFQDEGVDGSEV